MELSAAEYMKLSYKFQVVAIMFFSFFFLVHGNSLQFSDLSIFRAFNLLELWWLHQWFGLVCRMQNAITQRSWSDNVYITVGYFTSTMHKSLRCTRYLNCYDHCVFVHLLHCLVCISSLRGFRVQEPYIHWSSQQPLAATDQFGEQNKTNDDYVSFNSGFHCKSCSS